MIEVTHVMAPLVDEVFRRDEIKPCSLRGYLGAAGISLPVPVVALRIFDDAEPVPICAADWDALIEDGESVRLVHIPQRGGGGGSNPAALVATIALAATGMYAPVAAGIAGTMGGAALTAGIMVGGSYLVNAIFPPSVATPRDNSMSGSSLGAQSISTGGRIPAIDSPIPVAFGKNAWSPPRASHDWVEYVPTSDPTRPWDQYANVLLCLGVGEHELHRVEIAGSNIDALEDIEWQLVPPGGAITLSNFHDNMYTSPHVGGAELSKYGRKYYTGRQYADESYPPVGESGWTSDPSINDHCILYAYHPAPKIYPYIDFMPGEKVIVAWSGGSVEMTFQERRDFITPENMQYEIAVFAETSWPAGGPGYGAETYTITEKTENARIYVGPYPVCKPTQAVNQIAIDLVHPGGLYLMRDDGTYGYLHVEYLVEYRALSSTGTPVGGFATLGTIVFDERSTSELRTTHKFSVPSGCYEVRLSRPIANANIKEIDTCQWVGMRGRLPAKMTYAKVSVLAMRIKAGTYLNNAALNDITVLSTRKLPIHNGAAWSAPTATRSIAWAIADLSRNSDYSIGLPDDRVDIATLRSLDAIWAGRGDTCDGVLTTASTYWKALSMMARTGRAIPQVPGGIVTLMRDQPQTIKKASFHVRNIVRGSFSIEYILYEEDSPDDVLVKYTDSETGEAKEVQCNLPEADGVAPADFPMWGVGNYAQAKREGLFEAGCNMYRRTLASFTAANYSGRPLRRGHLVSVSHPLPGWGVSGEVLAVNKDTWTLTLSEPPVWTEGEDHYIQLTQSNGTPDGPWLVTPGAKDVEVVMAEDPHLDLHRRRSPPHPVPTRTRRRLRGPVPRRLHHP